MNKGEYNRILKLVKESMKQTSVKAKVNANIGLSYWTKQGFQVKETGLKYTAKSGKVYDAVKGITKDGKEMLLKATRGNSVYVAKDF